MIVHDIGFKPNVNPDVIYKEDLQILHNVRRGMTVLEKEGEFQFIRKGLPKFFDLNLEDEKSVEFMETLSRPLNALESGIEVLVMEKANGENIQVGHTHGLWIISSKNVSILVRSRVEID